MTLRLGSLFDGAGGFPLAATRVGIKPVWASEIEPLPILVTTMRLPGMAHLGDVRAIDGGSVAPVDIVTFGSPCQDLSVAGKRAGLQGARSGLFFQAVRDIKEMREVTNGRYPRFAVWENVPGALWSHHGADFHRALTSLISVVDKKAAADLPAISRWEKTGLAVGDGWSISWRVLDAQFFGVPQRRRRVFLVCDFGSERAPEILFESQGVSRDSAPRSQVWQTDAACFGDGVASPSGVLDVYALKMRGGKPGGGKDPLIQTGLSGTLRCDNDQTIFQPVAFGFNTIHPSRSAGCGRYGYRTEISKTLDTSGIAPTCNQGGIAIIDTAASNSAANSQEDHDAGHGGYRARRLTPLECARLQGFPDGWAEGLAITSPSRAQVDDWEEVWRAWNTARDVKPKTRRQVIRWLANPATDSALYKLWGNSIAVPVVCFVLERLNQYAQTTG